MMGSQNTALGNTIAACPLVPLWANASNDLMRFLASRVEVLKISTLSNSRKLWGTSVIIIQLNAVP